MEKRYVSLSTWTDKGTNRPKSSLAEIKEGTSKAGAFYQITDTNSTMIVDESYPVGSVIGFTMTMNTESSGKATTAKA